MARLPRKRVVEELRHYAEERPLFTKREVNRLTKRRTGELRTQPGKKNISTWEFRAAVTHAAETRKIHQVDAPRLFRQWRKWVDFPRRPQREAVRPERPEEPLLGFPQMDARRTGIETLPHASPEKQPHGVLAEQDSDALSPMRGSSQRRESTEPVHQSRLRQLQEERLSAKGEGTPLRSEEGGRGEPRLFSRAAQRFSRQRELPMREVVEQRTPFPESSGAANMSEGREHATRVLGERTASQERGHAPFREILVSGETAAAPEEEARQARGAADVGWRGEEESRGRHQRRAWWVFVILVAIAWLFEIASFSLWWGFAGTFVAFVLGLPLLPFFPILGFLQRDFDSAFIELVLIAAIAILAAYTWAETIRVVRRGTRRARQYRGTPLG